MPIKIHHGAPGSYKTSGALSDDLIPNLLKGRCIVTNVRGLTRDRVLENLPDCSESLEIINIDTSLAAGRDKFKLWFQWVPLGAFMIIDEAQMVFPKAWTKTFVSNLSISGTEIVGHENYGRPHDFTTAFEMHRHYNWDMVFTTPNIKLIRDDIRLCADGAFYHRDLGAVGFNGRYKESYHNATDSASSSNYISVTSKKVNKDVFKLYGSTATDEHSFTTAGIKIWKDPRLLVAFGVLAVSIYYAVSGFLSDPLLHKTVKTNDVEVVKVVDTQSSLSVEKAVNDHSPSELVFTDNVSSGQSDKDVSLKKVSPFAHLSIFLRASIKSSEKERMVLQFELFNDDKESFYLTGTDMYDAGYRILYKSTCYIQLIYESDIQDVICHGSDKSKVSTPRNYYPAQKSGEFASRAIEQDNSSANIISDGIAFDDTPLFK